MFEPLSTTVGACWIGYSALQGYMRRSSAVSDDATAVLQRATEVVKQEECSQFLFGRKADAISDLNALLVECSIPGWGAADGEPVNMLAVFVAEQFVRALPSHIPMPDFTVDPDGDVSLNWACSLQRRLTLSISATHRIAFAWLDGIERGHGVAAFDGLNIPSRVLSELNRLACNANTSLRAA